MGVSHTFRLDNSHLFYETGLPCVRGHISKRYKSTNQCLQCQQEYGFYNKTKYRLARYGLTTEDYNKLVAKQNFVCAICKQPETAIDGATQETKVLSIDHCHNSKKVRGLLCGKCNFGLGKFNDDVKLLEAAINYLKENDPWK